MRHMTYLGLSPFNAFHCLIRCNLHTVISTAQSSCSPAQYPPAKLLGFHAADSILAHPPAKTHFQKLSALEASCTLSKKGIWADLELSGVVEVGGADGLAHGVPVGAGGADGDALLLHDVRQLLPAPPSPCAALQRRQCTSSVPDPTQETLPSLPPPLPCAALRSSREALQRLLLGQGCSSAACGALLQQVHSDECPADACNTTPARVAFHIAELLAYWRTHKSSVPKI